MWITLDEVVCWGSQPKWLWQQLTWVKAIAGDTGALQAVGQFAGEEDVAQLAVAVGHEAVPAGLPRHQVLMGTQGGKVDGAQAVEQSRHVHHATLPALLQALQEQVGQQEVT